MRARSISLVFGMLLAAAGVTTQDRPQAPILAPVPGPVLVPASTHGWQQVGYIKASNPGQRDNFGHAVALSADGSTLAVGAPMEQGAARGINGNQADDSAYGAGAVYVYSRSGNVWTQQAYLKASNTQSEDRFGQAVSLSADGNTLAVSAYFEDSRATGINGDQADNSLDESGAVYVFTRTRSSWSQQAYIKASNTGAEEDGDQFGFSLSLSGDGNTLAVGAPSEDSAAVGVNGNQADNSAQGSGAAYVFVRRGSNWSQQAYVKAANAGPNDLFGYSIGLAADGNTLAVGAFDEGGSSTVVNGPYDDRMPGTGAVYVYTRQGSEWTQQAYLKAAQQDRADSMGASLAISEDGNTVASGALDEDSLTTGINVVQTGHSGRVGVPDDTSAGAAYAFLRTGTTWSQQANFKASNSGEEDWFAVHLALSGDGNTLAPAAPNEDSAAQGINGRQDDNSADEAGAVYVFTRNSGTWIHQVYVKGSNTEKFDEFGSSVALNRDGRLMAVGARNEDSAAKGLNGNQTDNSLSDSGAVYIFAR